MSRKIVALILAVGLLVTNCVWATAQETEDCSKYYDVLTGLNIICGYDEFDFGSTMQRYEFVNMVANFYGENGYSTVKSNEAIQLAYGYGLINSVEGFKPYADILYEEAIKIVVCALGYGRLAELQGGWPHGYLKIANRIKLLENVDGTVDMPMSKGNLTKLLYNAIDKSVMEQTAFGDDFEDYDVSEDTLLSLYRDIYVLEGRVEGTGYTMIYGRSSLDMDEISIDGKVYACNKPIADSYLGSTVEAYVRKNDFKDEIIYVTKVYEDDNLVINPKRYIGVNDDLTQLDYYSENEKVMSAKIAKSAYVIYNGESYADYTKKDFDITDGMIMLTDSDDNNVYDVINIISYENMFVAMISESGRFVTNEFEYDGASSILNLDDEKSKAKIRYIAPDGSLLNFKAIAPKQILSVARSKASDEPVITVYISNETIEGVVSERRDNRLLVDGEEYVLAHSYTEANAKGEELARLNILGQKACLYMDAFGMVAAAEVLEGNRFNYAYATKMSSDGVWAQDVKVRVFESDEVWREYPLAEKVKWNGNAEEAGNVYNTLCANGRLAPQLIGYELNSNNEINRLETGVQAGNSERLVRGEEVSGMYTSTNRSINWRVFFDDNTVVWVIPEEKSNESEYRIDNHTYFVHLVQHTAVPYNLDDYKFAPIVMVEEGKSYFNNSKDTGTLYVYLGSGESLDENGNQVKTVECVGGMAGKAEYLVSEYCEIPALEKGDAVKIRVNKNNVITNIERCFAFSEAGKEKVPANFYTTELMAGYVKQIDYGRQLFTVECAGEQTLRNDLYNSGTTFILNRNDNRGIIETCGFSDIEPGDYVVIRAQHSRLYDVYIIKNN